MHSEKISDISIARREGDICKEQLDAQHAETSKLFSYLMLAQWVCAIVLAFVASPLSWNGTQSSIHIHVLTALFLGGVITLPPVILSRVNPSGANTRYAVAVGQMLMSALLIHLTGGRIETHFHVFASLAFLAFYRDWKVLLTASIVIATDHVVRELWFPYSVFGIYTPGIARSLEHAWWVFFEDVILFLSIKRANIEQRKIAHALAVVEYSDELIKAEVALQTRHLTIHNEVSRVIAQPSSLLERRYELLQVLGTLLSADVGLFWAVSAQTTVLEPLACWSQGNPRLQNFIDSSMLLTLEKGIDLPGKVWEYATPQSVTDFTIEHKLPRLAEATKADLRFGVAFPIVSEEQVIGVMEFFLQSSMEITTKNRELFEVIGLQIGRCISRLATQEKLKVAEAASLRAQEEINQIRAALDEHAIVSIADVRGHISFVNEKFCAVSKYSREELIGQDHRIVNSGHHPKEFMQELWRTIANGAVWNGEVKNRAKDGSEYWVATSIVPFLDAQGKPTQYVSIRTDITAQKRSELKQQTLVLELDRSNKELADFAYVVSHDLKAPLRGVNSIATWIVSDYAEKLDDDGREQLKLMTNRIERMHGLIEGILQFSKVGREKLQTSAVDLQEAVKSLFEFLSIPEGITASIDTSLPTIIFEEVRIRQVFQNLLSNAVKYMGKPTGEIHVGYCESGAEIQFYVRDTGLGIEEKYFQKIFQLFQTLHARDEYEATGVGLALVKKIIETKGGRVWVESVVAQGSTFWFSLPDDLLVLKGPKAGTQGRKLKMKGEAII